jgi:hypothetical protein
LKVGEFIVVVKTVPGIARRLLSAELTYLTGELGEPLFYDYHLLDEAGIEYTSSFGRRYPLTKTEQEYVRGELEELVAGHYFFMGSSAVCLGSKYAVPTCHFDYLPNRLGDEQALADESSKLLERVKPFVSQHGGKAWVESDRGKSRHYLRLMLPLSNVTTRHSNYEDWVVHLRENLSSDH